MALGSFHRHSLGLIFQLELEDDGGFDARLKLTPEALTGDALR